MALPYAFRAFNGATRYSLLKPVVNVSPPVPVQPSCSKATFDTHCSKRSSSCQTALSEEILYLLLFLATFSILYIIITAKICQARISTNHAPDTFFLSEKAAVPHPHSRFSFPIFKNASAFLLRGGSHLPADIICQPLCCTWLTIVFLHVKVCLV